MTSSRFTATFRPKRSPRSPRHRERRAYPLPGTSPRWYRSARPSLSDKARSNTVLGGSALVGASVIAAVVGLILMLRHSYKSQHSKFATNHRLADAAWIFSAISPIAALGVAGMLHDGRNGLMVYLLTFAPIAVLASTHLAAPLLIHAGRFLLRRKKALSHDP